MVNQKGFSLVEVIIAITIISVIGVFTSTLLTRTYRSSSDTEQISKLKQNGEVASNNIGEAIRVADSIVCSSPDKKWIVIRTIEGKYWLFRFIDPIPLTGTPTQNGYIAKQENLPKSQFDNFCVTNPPNFASNVIITDFVSGDVNTGVSISNGEFIRLQGPDGKDTVTIKFEVGSPGQPAGSLGTVKMQTTVQVR